MALYVVLGLALVFTLRSFVSWRSGILMMILLAAVQDPLRKMVPGTPGWLALVTAPIFLAAVVTSMASTRRWWGEFQRHYPRVGKALLLLLVLSVPPAIISATYGAGSWQLTLVGYFSYSIIFLAVISGFHFARNIAELRRVLAFYCIVHGLMLTGGIFEFMGWFPGWQVLGDDAFGFNWIRHSQGYIVDIVSGFYRSGDVMGWHAAAVVLISMVLAYTARGNKRLMWAFVSAGAMLALLLCGRRKMVYMVPVFLLSLGWLYWQAGRSTRVLALVGLFAFPIASVFVVGDLLGDGEDAAQMRYYTETSTETLDRFQVHGFASLAETYRQSGFFGEGLGTATPGSHHIKVARPRIWQESAPSRILVELGVAGALGFLAVMVTIILALWRVVRNQLWVRSPYAGYAAGLLAFFLANVGSLTVSGQILADPFIASFLGFLVGVTLSFARERFSAAPPVPAPAPVPQADPGARFRQALPR